MLLNSANQCLLAIVSEMSLLEEINREIEAARRAAGSPPRPVHWPLLLMDFCELKFLIDAAILPFAMPSCSHALMLLCGCLEHVHISEVEAARRAAYSVAMSEKERREAARTIQGGIRGRAGRSVWAEQEAYEVRQPCPSTIPPIL